MYKLALYTKYTYTKSTHNAWFLTRPQAGIKANAPANALTWPLTQQLVV